MRRENWRELSTALVVWLFLAAAQSALIVGLGSSRTPVWAIVASFTAHAVAWTGITLVLRRVPRAVSEGYLRKIVWLILLAGAGLLDAFVRRAVTELLIGPVSVSFGRTVLYYADVTTLSFVLAVWIGRVIDTREALFAHARHELSLNAQLGRARLGYLHAQLQPHFLFNALGTVSELVFENPSAAIRTFRQLIAVLRAAASRDVAEIPLHDELEVLSPYLEVQRTRFSDWLEIDVQIDPRAESLLVPALVLQPLVENSIRHGLRDRSSRGRILISASVSHSRLVLSVRDNGVGLRSPVTMRRTGVGLSNTEERLTTLYGSEASLRLFNDEAGGAVAEVSIPVRKPEAAATNAEPYEPAGSVSHRPGFAERHPVAALALGCVAASFLWTQQSYAYLSVSGRLGQRSAFDLARDDFVMVVLWTVIVPAAIWISRRFPFDRGSVLRTTVIHVLALTSLGMLHAALTAMYRDNFSPSSWLAVFSGSMPVTLLVYLGALIWAQRRVFEDWLAARQMEAIRIGSEITEAKFAAASLSVAPERLEFTLGELERYAATDPLRAESVITELGSELRSTLESVAMDRTADRPSGSGSASGREDRVERLAMGA